MSPAICATCAKIKSEHILNEVSGQNHVSRCRLGSCGRQGGQGETRGNGPRPDGPTARDLENYGCYDFIADGAIVGRIMFFSATLTELPWVWTIAPGYEEDRSPTHGYAATLEAATQAFARSCHR